MKKLQFKLAAAMIFGSIGLSACGSDDGTPVLNPLDGNWVTTCKAEYEDDPATIYGSENIAVDGDVMVATFHSFQDSECTIPLPAASEGAFVYSLKFPEGTVETSLGTAYPIDITVKSVCENYPSSCEPFLNLEIKEIYLVKDNRWFVGQPVIDETMDEDTRPIEIDASNYVTRR